MNKEFQECIAELITPESQAWSDYVEGKDDNPYTKDSAEWGRYRVSMRRNFEREISRSKEA